MAGWAGWAGWGGWAGWAGWAGWGGSNGGSGNNPGDALLTQALMNSRSNTVGNVALSFNGSVPTRYSLVDNVDNLDLWEPLVRFNVCLFDTLNRLSFVPVGNTATLFTNGIGLITLARPSDIGVFKAQLKMMMAYVDARERSAPEIVTQLKPQTPFWASALNMQPGRHRKTGELIELALAVSSIICMRFKHAFNVPRPAVWSDQVQPIVPTPEHGSLPSGHATEAFVVAYLMERLIGNNGTGQLFKQAERIAKNRQIAGVHFPIDSETGRLLGEVVANFLEHLATGIAVQYKTFDAEKFVELESGGHDFSLADAERPTFVSSVDSIVVANPAPSPLVAHIWSAAKKEWA